MYIDSKIPINSVRYRPYVLLSLNTQGHANFMGVLESTLLVIDDN